MDTQVLMDKLIKAVSYQFKTDKTSPGVTISSLKHGYYASVVRYEGSFAKGKVVVCKAKGDTLDDALRAVAQKFLEQVQPAKTPIDELDGAVRYTHQASRAPSAGGLLSSYRDDTDCK